MDAGNRSDLRLELKQVFDASPEEVFSAWLDAGRIAKWMGPKGVQAEAQVLEPRVGGRYKIFMRTPDGANPTVGGVYREIERHRRLVFTWTWEHDKQETLITLNFRAVGKKTEMTLLHENFANTERRDSHKHGWTGSFEKLAECLAE
jgi:uncharacterized protein YndB with AHSA1/START domain